MADSKCAGCGKTESALESYFADCKKRGIFVYGEGISVLLFCDNCRKSFCGRCQIDLGMSSGCPECSSALRDLGRVTSSTAPCPTPAQQPAVPSTGPSSTPAETPAMPSTKNCSRCGCAIPKSDTACKYCGHIDWSGPIVAMVLTLTSFSVGIFWFEMLIWKIIFIGVGALLFLAVCMGFWEILTVKKRMAAARAESADRPAAASASSTPRKIRKKRSGAARSPAEILGSVMGKVSGVDGLCAVIAQVKENGAGNLGAYMAGLEEKEMLEWIEGLNRLPEAKRAVVAESLNAGEEPPPLASLMVAPKKPVAEAAVTPPPQSPSSPGVRLLDAIAQSPHLNEVGVNNLAKVRQRMAELQAEQGRPTAPGESGSPPTRQPAPPTPVAAAPKPAPAAAQGLPKEYVVTKRFPSREAVEEAGKRLARFKPFIVSARGTSQPDGVLLKVTTKAIGPHEYTLLAEALNGLNEEPPSSPAPETKPPLPDSGSENAPKWYVLPKGQKKDGPFHIEELRLITPTIGMRIRREGNAEWIALQNARKAYPELGEAHCPLFDPTPASLSPAPADQTLVIEFAARAGQSIDTVAGELSSTFRAMKAMGHDRDTLMQLALENLFRHLRPRSIFLTGSVQSVIEAPDSKVTLLASLTGASEALRTEVAHGVGRPVEHLAADDPFLQTLKPLKVDCYWRSPSCGRAGRAVVFTDPATR